MIERLRLEVEDEKEFISSILSEIGVVKGEMMSLDYYYSKTARRRFFAGFIRDTSQSLSGVAKLISRICL